MGRIAEPLAADGRVGRRRPTAACRSSIEGGALTRDRVRAAGRERAGEVGDPARRARRRGARRPCVEPAPTRDHTELMLAAAGARVARRPGSVTVEPGGHAAPARGARPRRHLVGGAVPRRGGAAARLDADRPRRRPQPAAHRASSTCSSGWARASASSTGARSPASRRRRRGRAAASSSRRRSAAAEVPRLVDELPLVALLAVDGARRRRASRGAEELRAKESDRIETVDRRAARDRRAHRGARRRLRRPRRARAAARRHDRRRRRPPDRDARRGRGRRLARGRAARGRRVRVEISFPGFYDLLATVAVTGDIGA